MIGPCSWLTWLGGPAQAQGPVWSCSVSINKTKLTENDFLAQLSWQAQCPQLTHLEPDGGMAAWGHRVEVRKGGLPCDAVTLVQPGTSALVERWSRALWWGAWTAPARCVGPAQLFPWPCAEPDDSHFSSPLLGFLSGWSGQHRDFCSGCGNICTNMALQRTSGKEWRWTEEKVETCCWEWECNLALECQEEIFPWDGLQ